MKNIIIKIVIGLAVVGVGTFLAVYGFGGGLDAGQNNTAIIGDIVDIAAESSTMVDVGSSSDFSFGDNEVKAPNAKVSAKKSSAKVSGTGANTSTPSVGAKTASPSTAGQAQPSGSSSGQVSGLAGATATVAAKTTSSAQKASPLQVCAFTDANADSASRKVILNEIAWMGSLPQTGETATQAGARELIELKNLAAGEVDVSGWQILDSTGNLKIAAKDGTTIPVGGLLVLTRGADYSGALSNSGGQLALFDAGCAMADFLDASAGWPGGNNTTKQTLERDADGAGWHTSASPGGTPGAENSVAPVAASTSTTIVATTTRTSTPPIPQQYAISVSSVGNGMGTVSSSPSGILCGFACYASFSEGTNISFAATPTQDSMFKGWVGGPCGGSAAAQCLFTVSGTIALVADFELLPPDVPATDLSDQSSSGQISPGQSSSTQNPIQNQSSTNPSTGNSADAPNHLVIAAIQIAGAASANDFVKIFNPTGASVDLSGWKLHKKSSTGTDYSLKTFANGSAIAPGTYFTWANSSGGFAQSINADTSSTETLSADNSVALMDASGVIIDQVAWGTGSNQYVEGMAYATDPTANQVLTRKTAGGAPNEPIDSDNNANDFVLQ